MSRPLVTALINTHNYGRFVGEAIESVLAQDFPREQMEVIVVDDGSTDDTAERVKKYGDAIYYLPKPCGGQGSAINFGIEHSSGEIIVTLDADDVWLPGKLRSVAEALESHPEAGMLYHHLEVWAAGGDAPWNPSPLPATLTHFPPRPEDLESHFIWTTSVMAFRKRLLREVLPIPDSLVIMMDLYVAGLMPFVAPVIRLSEVLTKYRNHGQNLCLFSTSAADRERFQRRLACEKAGLAEIARWLSHHGIDPRRPDVKAYLDRLKFSLIEFRLGLGAASRFEHLAYLRYESRRRGQEWSARYRMFQWAAAGVAFLLGPRGYSRLRERYGSGGALVGWRERMIPHRRPTR
jgi:glycosyltransferase involved in cell wall biosynthesis